jgi:DNA-binding MarR family transcriptional regulator
MAPIPALRLDSGMAEWTFLTNHAHVLVCLARDPYAPIGSLAEQVGIDEGAVDGILEELVAGGYVEEQTEHRRLVRRVVRRDRPLRHPVEAHHPVSRLLDAVEEPAERLERRIRGGD